MVDTATVANGDDISNDFGPRLFGYCLFEVSGLDGNYSAELSREFAYGLDTRNYVRNALLGASVPSREQLEQP